MEIIILISLLVSVNIGRGVDSIVALCWDRGIKAKVNDSVESVMREAKAIVWIKENIFPLVEILFLIKVEVFICHSMGSSNVNSPLRTNVLRNVITVQEVRVRLSNGGRETDSAVGRIGVSTVKDRGIQVWILVVVSRHYTDGGVIQIVAIFGMDVQKGEGMKIGKNGVGVLVLGRNFLTWGVRALLNSPCLTKVGFLIQVVNIIGLVHKDFDRISHIVDVRRGRNRFRDIIQA